MNRGYVKLYRKSLDNDLIRNPVAWQFMCWCLLKATHKAHRQLVGTIPVALEPGQFIFGRASAAKELQSTERKVRTCLDLLQKMDFLKIETTNKFSVITIINWDTYQEERPAGDQQAAPEKNSFCQQNDQQNANGDNGLQGDSDQQNDQQATSKRPADFDENDQQNDQQNANGDNGLQESASNKRPAEKNDISEKATTNKNNKNIRDKNKRSLCPVFEEDSVPYRLAVYMHGILKANLPTLKEPNLQKWASDFDVAIRNDPRMKDTRYVAQVIKWACSDSFWKANIQSPGKLREKFDQLAAKMESMKNSRASPSARIGPSRNGNAYNDGRERDYGQSDFGALGGNT